MIKEINNEEILDIISDYFGIKNPFNVYSKTLVYEENNIIKGILVYDEIYDRIEIDYILVLNKYKKNGIGTMLINSIDKKNISLEVRKSNIEAIKFYQKCGFKIVAERKQYYKNEDGYLMCKEVTM